MKKHQYFGVPLINKWEITPVFWPKMGRSDTTPLPWLLHSTQITKVDIMYKMMISFNSHYPRLIEL
jgi:hypothetical protein